MTPSPILRVLSTLTTSGVRSLLMGGQACVLYGGTEFSRDTDIVMLADDDNLGRLATAVAELEAEVIAVPPFTQGHLRAGHAVHFRCRAGGVEGMRLDVMARIRGLPDFAVIWERRTTIDTAAGPIEVLSLPDLVTAKKTQRDKDWPMITRLVEADYAAHGPRADSTRTAFWLRELRTPSILIDVARSATDVSESLVPDRPLLAAALAGDTAGVAAGLVAEEAREREADRIYWVPLRQELERLRLERRPRQEP